jgi:transposase-like protein
MRRRDTDAVITSRSVSSAPAGYRFPREVIAVAVRWYLRYGLSYRDVEELLAERGIEVDHVTIYRWVQTFTAEFIDAARPARHASGDRGFVDETYIKVAGRWAYLYRAVDQYGQVIDVLLSRRRDAAAARAFFTRALRCGPAPVEVVTDRAPVYPRVVDEVAPRPLRDHPRPARAGSGPRRVRGAGPVPLTAGTVRAIEYRRALPSLNATPPSALVSALIGAYRRADGRVWRFMGVRQGGAWRAKGLTRPGPAAARTASGARSWCWCSGRTGSP